MKALSIKQPWAWLIVMGFKTVENRTWHTKFRGEFLIHAGKTMDNNMFKMLDRYCTMCNGFSEISMPDKEKLKKMIELWPGAQLLRGGVIGKAEIVDCVDKSDNEWFQGPHGLIIANPTELPFIPMAGKLGFFEVNI